MARCFAVSMSQPPGFGGTPSRGHCSSAATYASWASSSAVAISPATRVRPATSRGHSIRQDASTARRAASTDEVTAGRSGRLVELPDLDPDLPLRAVDPQEARRPFHRLLLRAGLQQTVSADDLLGLGERAVDHGLHTLGLVDSGRL